MSLPDPAASGPVPDWLTERFVGRDGVALCVRPLGPADSANERAFIEGLSPESLYQRLMGVIKGVSDAQFAALLQPDWPRSVALAIFRCDAPAGASEGVDAPREVEILGVARFAESGEPQVAEFAIVVTDAWQRRGLGHALFERLVRAARAAGYRQLVGTTFGDNRRMLDLARSLGFESASDDGDTSLRRLTLSLEAPSPPA
ncbi:MAG TPA: GNAT family N-acetyltransferase [Burkholderiaceae bacterium]|nr:GNAT family N-acetyltransferase [Burkholderiaceae bacterium]